MQIPCANRNCKNALFCTDKNKMCENYRKAVPDTNPEELLLFMIAFNAKRREDA